MFGWMAFMPLHPSYHGVPFDSLAYIPSAVHKEREGYAMPEDLVQRWAQLDCQIVTATSILGKFYMIGAVRPFSPWAQGYHLVYRTPDLAHEQATRSRLMFRCWMGLFSYLIATGMEKAEKRVIGSIPPWFEVLAKEGFHQSWLAAINSSTVTSFQSHIQRVGTFVELQPTDKSQPPITFFCSYKVLVWYPATVSYRTSPRFRIYCKQ
jgi:hypothetical protein